MSDRVSGTVAVGRIHSLDQFRGYCVLGMLVVNFLAHLEVTPHVLKHHNTYFSYADSVLPGFLFAVGFAFRLTWLRRIGRQDRRSTMLGYVRRSAALVVISVILSGVGLQFADWHVLDAQMWGQFLARLFKANLWEVLAIIGVTQICLLPLIDRSIPVRAIAMVLFLLVHIVISYAFNFAFVLGLPNGLDQWMGTTGVRCWDGGVFGILSWSVVMLAGTIAYDIVSRIARPSQAAFRFLAIGTVCCGAGYLLNCVSCLYEPVPNSMLQRGYASSPVLPDWSAVKQRPLFDLLAEPPLMPIPEDRPWSYWLMSKRLVSAPFVLFATGFSLLTYSLFLQACDAWGLQSRLLRTFGQNALLAFALHHLILRTVTPLVPANSPVWYALIGLLAFVILNDRILRYLERQQIVIRL